MTDVDVSHVRIVVPSISPSAAARTCEGWLGHLAARGAQCVVVANSASVWEAAVFSGIHMVSREQNMGFSRAINFGSSGKPHWDVLVIANDDLSMSTEDADDLLETVCGHREGSPLWLVSFDTEEARRLPGLRAVFENLSLLESVRRRVFNSHHEKVVSKMSSVPSGWYHSFSLVAISRELWTSVGGMNEDYLFCYEDADFSRRTERIGVQSMHREFYGEHEHSSSSKNHIDSVLPVVVDSALTFLRNSGYPDVIGRAIAVVGLLIRVPLVFFSNSDVRRHLRGVGRGLRIALSFGERPRLPEYGSL